MIREVVKIDEGLCNGCGECIPNCHEGALQLIDGKARLISDLFCDGLGACIGHCPLGAISIEKREAEDYDEIKTIEIMVEKGKNTVLAHLVHLKEHNEQKYLEQGLTFLKNNSEKIAFNIDKVLSKLEYNHNLKSENMNNHSHQCPGASEIHFVQKQENKVSPASFESPSELTHWPVQLHLINPAASYFQKADILVAADCTAFAMGNFHTAYLRGKSLIIACPKLDSNKDIYVDKIQVLIEKSLVNTITVLIMEVPCCGGLMSIVEEAIQKSERKVPVKLIICSVQGEVLSEEWAR
jgi:NAD-dependent dihydropyrimidine dehydrogenase PreA subunit